MVQLPEVYSVSSNDEPGDYDECQAFRRKVKDLADIYLVLD